MAVILVASDRGLVTLDPRGKELSRDFPEHVVTALAPEVWERTWAVVDGHEIWRGRAGEWEPVGSIRELRGFEQLEAACLADTRANPLGGILIGTSGAHLVRVTEDHRMEPIESFEHAPGRESWHTPWGGPAAVRTISEDRDRVYVNVHVGGILRSADEGATWEPTIDIGVDVHRVTTGAGRVYAAAGAGLFISDDRGDGWRKVTAGLHATYCRAAAVRGSTLLVSASTGPHGGRAALYWADLDAQRFEPCREGLPERFEGNIDSLCLDALPAGGLAAFATEAGEIYSSSAADESWVRIASGMGRINRILTLP